MSRLGENRLSRGLDKSFAQVASAMRHARAQSKSSTSRVGKGLARAATRSRSSHRVLSNPTIRKGARGHTAGMGYPPFAHSRQDRARATMLLPKRSEERLHLDLLDSWLICFISENCWATPG